MVRSRAVAQGYIMGGPPGPSPLRDGVYRTGDLGVFEEGFLSLRGRRDRLINVGGLKVSPDEVVATLESHPAVWEAAVTGVRDAAGEEVVYAVVALRAAATERDLLTFCRARLAEHKVPRRIDVGRELPRGPTGKVRIRREDSAN